LKLVGNTFETASTINSEYTENPKY